MIYVYNGHAECDSKRIGFPNFSHVFEGVSKYNASTVLRWGRGGDIFDRYGRAMEFKHVLNPAKAIQLNCQKHLAIREISKVAKTPRIFNGLVPARKLGVLRSIQHTNGHGFTVVRGPKRYNTETHYATEFLKTDVEYRVWFCGNSTLCARRVNKSDKSKYPCRSLYLYRFCKTPKTLQLTTLKASNIIGLDVGAADVLYHKGVYKILELNSAPSVDARRIRLFYASALKRLVKRKFPEVKI